LYYYAYTVSLQFLFFKETLPGTESLILDSSRKINQNRGRNKERSSLMRGILLINKPVSTIMGKYSYDPK
jgi:hypothetical protein